MTPFVRKTLLALAVATLAAPVATVQALEAGEILVRAGLGYVSPNDDSDVPGLDVESDASLALTIAYMLTPNIGLELVGALPFSHDIELNGAKVAETDHLPPTVLAQYYFNSNGSVRPYAGVGINYTAFFNTDTQGALAGSKLDLDNSWGLAGEVGVDIDLNTNWLFNASVWYMDIDTDATLDGAPLTTVQIDPWVMFVGAGYRF